MTSAALVMTEDDFKSRVMDAARRHGWMCCHFRPARTTAGWRTPLEGDSGCPDLILARDGVVILAELKSQRGRIRPEQTVWLRSCGAHGRLWRPDMWPEVLAELAAKRSTPS